MIITEVKITDTNITYSYSNVIVEDNKVKHVFVKKLTINNN